MPRLPADPARRRALARSGLAVLALAALVAVVALTVGVPAPSQLAAWAESAGPAAPVLFVLIAAVSTCVMFPGQVTATAAGVLFGVAGGVALTLAAATLGAALAFLLARGVGAGADRPAARPARGALARRGSPSAASAPC